MLTWAIVAFYGMFAFVGLLNLFVMRRPGRSTQNKPLLVLIPARNEEKNLAVILPLLQEQMDMSNVIVFDDESEDQTAEVAQKLGAQVIRPKESLPEGWTGKNRACYELAQAAAQTEFEWWLFLDADVQPQPGFISAISSLCENARPEQGVITGFPHILPGRGIEPIFLAWVGWILLTTNPYGLVSRSGIGHSQFKNGQIHCWRREIYLDLQPNRAVKSNIMEDVMIGRLLAKKKVQVEVANLSSVMKVRMYTHWHEALDGMSKNSFEITGSVAGSLAIAAFFLFVGWGWLLAGPHLLLAYGLFLLSGVAVCTLARTVWWPLLIAPVIPMAGAYTMIRSTIWHQRGTVKWKGRIYSNKKKGLP